MSKQVKNLITKELTAKLGELDGVGVINPRGIDGNKNNKLRRSLLENGLKMTVVKNTLARRSVEGKRLAGFDKLLDGPSAVVYGSSVGIANVARALLSAKKDNDALELRGMFFDGEVYIGLDGVKIVSTMPTREEAIGNLVGMILGPGSMLAAALKGPGGTLGAILKAIEEKAPKVEDAPVAAEVIAAPTEAAAPAASA